MSTSYGIMFIVHLYLHFLCSCFLRDFCTQLYQVFPSNTNNLHTVLWFQVFLSNANNLHTVVWLQVFLSNSNNNMVSRNYFYLIIIICLFTVIWFYVPNNNPLQTITASSNYF